MKKVMIGLEVLSDGVLEELQKTTSDGEAALLETIAIYLSKIRQIVDVIPNKEPGGSPSGRILLLAIPCLEIEDAEYREVD